MQTFSYQEAIDSRYSRYLRPEFNLNLRATNESKLIRLLLGTLTITNLYSGDSFDQKNNYSILGKPTNAIVTTKIIKECLEPEVKLDSLCEYLKKSRTINNPFYLSLIDELSNYFYKTAKNSNTIAFLHLYRVIEYISYSFPLIYASMSREYYGSFNSLKNYFIDQSKNELLFFNEFTKGLLDKVLLDTPLTFNFNTLSPDLNNNHYQIFNRFLFGKSFGLVPGISITTTYEHLLQLSIDLRNRYFHFAVGGQRNIKSSEIIESDVFYNIINEELVNWISIIYFEILKVAVEKSK